MKRNLGTAFMIMALMVLVLSGFTPIAQAGGPIVLKAVTFLPLHVIDNKGLLMLADILKKNSKGALTIKIIGGPEAIRSFDQFEATRKGVVDIMMAPESYFAAPVTNVPSGHLSELTVQEERDNGVYKLRREIFAKHNIYFLGLGKMGGNFYFWLKDPIDKPQDMAGRKIRVSPYYIPFMKALGASPVVMPPTQVYTALERGVVDGFGWPVSGVVDHRWQEVVKYVIGHGVWNTALPILMNLKTHEKLSRDMQKVLDDSMIEAEKKIAAFWVKAYQNEWKRVLEAGVTRVEFSPKDAKYYVDLAKTSSWEDVMKNIKPKELGPKLKKLLTK